MVLLKGCCHVPRVMGLQLEKWHDSGAPTPANFHGALGGAATTSKGTLGPLRKLGVPVAWHQRPNLKPGIALRSCITKPKAS